MSEVLVDVGELSTKIEQSSNRNKLEEIYVGLSYSQRYDPEIIKIFTEKYNSLPQSKPTKEDKKRGFKIMGQLERTIVESSY